MRKILLGLGLLVSCFCFIGHAYIGSPYAYLPGTVATIEALNTAMVKINIDGVTKEAMIVVPYMKRSEATVEVVTTIGTAEIAYALPLGTTDFLFRSRSDSDLKVSYVTGAIAAGNYLTIKYPDVYFKNNLFTRGLTVYIVSVSPSVEVEMEIWK